MASYKILVENYERREKELNASLVAFYLQTGHLLLSGKTDQKDDEFSRSYELISSEISSINDQCREISANEQRKAELEKSVQALKKAIQEYEPEKKSRYTELGDYIFKNYTQHFASTFGTVYPALCEEKKNIDSIEGKLAEITEQLESKDFFSKLVLYVKQSSLKAQLSVRVHRFDELKAEGAEKAFKSGAVNTDNGGTAYSACRILQEEIDSTNAKLEDAASELNKVCEKLKEADKKSRLLAAAAEKAGELDKLAESAGVKLVNKYVSPDAVMLAAFPGSYARIFSGVVETRRELCSIARRKEMLRCSEQIDSAVASMDAMNKEVVANKADIERLVKRNEELTERIASTAAAAESIKQRKIALEVEEGVSVNRLLGVSTEDASASDATNVSNSADTAGSGDGANVSASADASAGVQGDSTTVATDAGVDAAGDAPKPKQANKPRKSASANAGGTGKSGDNAAAAGKNADAASKKPKSPKKDAGASSDKSNDKKSSGAKPRKSRAKADKADEKRNG